jgi:hypothetical protein
MVQKRSLRRSLALSTIWLAMACGSSTQLAPGVAGPAGAAGTAVVAAVVWAVAGGCKLQGCPYGSYCNEHNGLCVAQTCAAGCPHGKVCNEGLNRCQDAPKAKVPSDFLPQDDRRNLSR